MIFSLLGGSPISGNCYKAIIADNFDKAIIADNFHKTIAGNFYKAIAVDSHKNSFALLTSFAIRQPQPDYPNTVNCSCAG